MKSLGCIKPPTGAGVALGAPRRAHPLYLGVMCWCVLWASTVDARELNLDIRAVDLATAVAQLAEAAGLQVLYVSEVLDRRRAPPLVGRFEPRQALDILFRDSGLEYEIRNGDTLIVRSAARAESTQSASPVPPRVPASKRRHVAVVETSGEIAGIIVQARKRDALLLRTPESITALTSESLQWRQPGVLTDVYRQVPGLFVMDRGPYLRKLFVRGIQNDVDTGGGTVGVYVDDLPMSLTGRTDLHLFDIDRLEVLRGPQGTLYGANSMTGAVKYIFNTAEPGVLAGLAEARLSATHHGGWNHALDAMINLPLDDARTALRLVGYRLEESGFVGNRFEGLTLPAYAGLPADYFFPGSPPVQGHGEIRIPSLREDEINAHQVTGGRASMTFAPHEQLTVRATLFGERGFVRDGQRHQPSDAGDLHNALNVLLPIEDDFVAGNIVIEHDRAAYDLYATANLLRRTSRFTEPFADQFPAELTPPGTELVSRDRQQLLTTELRLSSNTATRWSWLAGLFYMELDSAATQWVWLQHDHSNQTVDDELPFAEQQLALFGETSWRLTQRLTAGVGARLFKVEQATGPVTHRIEPAVFLLPPRGTDGIERRFSDVVATYRFNLAWDNGTGMLLYAQAAQGFRVGGVNTNITRNPQVPSTYGSDDLWSYELGMKLRLFGGQLVLDGAAYLLDWSDVQTRVFVNGAGFNLNAGRAHVAGVELTVFAEPLDDLEIQGSFSLLDAVLDDAEPHGNFPTGSEGRAGDRLPGVPRAAGQVSVQYSLTMASGAQWHVAGGASYTGASLTEFRGARAEKLRGYALSDFALGYSTGAWTTQLFVHNVFDRRADLNISHFLNQPRTVTPNQPRTIGMSLSREF